MSIHMDAHEENQIRDRLALAEARLQALEQQIGALNAALQPATK